MKVCLDRYLNKPQAADPAAMATSIDAIEKTLTRLPPTRLSTPREKPRRQQSPNR